VSTVRSYTARHAVTDYLRSLGCSDEEMEPMGEDAVAWRGAVYIGVESSDTDASASSPSETGE
jgi:uncharacterized tellurite resistance protein B-like protein